MGYQDILWLEIAMDNGVSVEVVDARYKLAKQVLKTRKAHF